MPRLRQVLASAAKRGSRTAPRHNDKRVLVRTAAELPTVAAARRGSLGYSAESDHTSRNDMPVSAAAAARRANSSVT